MKKLSIILLALAFALVMAVPAMAIHIGDDQTAEGGLGITGTYKIDGEARDVDGVTDEFYDDDFEVVLKFSTGPVTATIDLEISDDGSYDAKNITRSADIVDNYYLTYQAMDSLQFKFGEYSCGFARVISTDGACGHNVQGMYSLDAADITLILSKLVEGSDSGGDDGDTDSMVLKVDLKAAGPFDTLALYYNNITSELNTPDAEVSYTGVDVALPLGPVAFAMEYGALGGDGEGNFMVFEIGLGDLVGFDVGINYFQSSDDYTAAFSGNDWAPMNIYGDNINEMLYDTSAIWVTFGYGVNDKLSLSAAALVQAENDAGDAYGSEFDVGMKYKLADNVTYQASYASYAEGDAVDPEDVDYTELFHRLTLKF
jgi:hypothetical protein